METLLYYIKKHHLYEHKIKVSSLRWDMLFTQVNIIRNQSRMLPFFVRKWKVVSCLLQKKIDESDMFDVDGTGRGQKHWGSFFDKGYTGANRDMRATIPKSKGPRQSLPTMKKKRNAEISGDGIIVETWFGRLVMLWGIFSKQFRWSEQKYDDLLIVCACLTNYHNAHFPLREQGTDESITMKKKNL